MSNRIYRRIFLLSSWVCIVLPLILISEASNAQEFNFKTSEGSEILSGSDLFTHGFPDTMKFWCYDWDHMFRHPTNWGDTFKLKSNHTFVKFFVDNCNLHSDYQTNIHYTYRLTYEIYGYKNPADTTSSTSYSHYSDTLTIGFNNFNDNTPFQDLHLRKYSGFYKAVVILSGLYIDTNGVISPMNPSDPAWQNFKVEGSILTQRYDKVPYGISTPPTLTTPVFSNNKLKIGWDIGSIGPVSYELEWSYIDDYSVSLDTGGVSSITSRSASDIGYDFRNNCTRVWLDSNSYNIPIVYPHGYLVYRVRAVRPDSVQFRYPVYGTWSLLSSDHDLVSAVTPSSSVYTISSPYMSDSLNWQYTSSFAEGGKYKNVVSFFDGLLKNRQSITRFNSSPDYLIATENVYDYEGRLSIKTLPAPISTPSFFYQHDVAVDSITDSPYHAALFDAGVAICPNNNLIPPLNSAALASIYYSRNNPDTEGSQRYVPDAEGYPMVQTVYEPGYADRIAAQGGAGRALQIGSSNTVANYYVSPGQSSLNALFGPNVGWSSYYNMVVNNDPNQQLSMTIKDYKGKTMASSMIGTGPNPATHAIVSIDVPGSTYYTQNILQPGSPTQAVDTLAGTRTADADYFNEAAGIDTLNYLYKFNPFHTFCDSQYLGVKGHYDCYVIDNCGNIELHQTETLGMNGLSDSTPVTYTSPSDFFAANAAQYHVHKTLSFYPSDIVASVDSFISGANCLLTEPYFIRKSVDSAEFPCPLNTIGNPGDPCSQMKQNMLLQLYPGAVYGKYFQFGTNVVGDTNSIFSTVCPPDTFHILRYHHDTVFYRCYSETTDNSYIWNTYTHGTNIYLGGGSSYSAFMPSTIAGEILLPDTCTALSSYSTTATIQIRFSDSLNLDTLIGSLHISGVDSIGVFKLFTASDSLHGESGNIHDSSGYLIGSITQLYTPPGCQIIIPVIVSGNIATGNLSGALPSGASIKINFSEIVPTIDSVISVAIVPYPVDSLAGFDSISSLCHFRYQDSCTVPSLPNSITVNGFTYTGLRTMSADSFIMIYNEAIAAGNDTIAEALLPLHPQYCELQNCFNDTFKTQVLSIPDFTVAQSLGLLLLDSIVAHDPLVGMMTATGMFMNPMDSLMTYPGGNIRLDSQILMDAYCGCNYAPMFIDCINNMFPYEIGHHLLVNDLVKKNYFDKIINVYFLNRQKYVNDIFTLGGNACSHCALVRMNLDPSAALPPAGFSNAGSFLTDSTMSGSPSSGWISGAIGSVTPTDTSFTAIYDSLLAMVHFNDSLLAYTTIDSVVSNLSNCILGFHPLALNVKDSLEAIYLSGKAPNGNFTPAQIRHVITSNGILLDDLCNPYTLNCYQFGNPPTLPSGNCLSDSFYLGMQSFFMTSQVLNALETHFSYFVTLDTVGNVFEQKVGRFLGGDNHPSVHAEWIDSASEKLYVLQVFSSLTGASVSVFLHSQCDNLFQSSGCGAFSIRVNCVNDYPDLAYTMSGMVGQYAFVANVNPFFCGNPGCAMLGWISVDTLPTMSYLDNTLRQCIPCTQMRSLYTRFNDTLSAYGITGSDHPLYGQMLTNFMNYNLGQICTTEQYETFIQSCALADSLIMPLYVHYATFNFANIVQADTFVNRINRIDSFYTFDDAYRDSSSATISIGIDLNSVPVQELWKYKKFFNDYPSSLYDSRIINQSFSSLQPANDIGVLYVNPAFPFSPADSGIISTTDVTFSTPTERYIWTGTHFELSKCYDVIASSTTPPYENSKDIYTISNYLISHAIAGVSFTPNNQSTINNDYFKPQKQAYLHYVYGLQSLPPYEVLDSIQALNLTLRVPGYSAYNASYSLPIDPSMATNLYLDDIGSSMSTPYFDTLQKIIEHASTVTSGYYIFYDTNRIVTFDDYPRQLTAFHCSDGSYWYRYFSSGDTMYNVYVSFPPYIPTYLHKYYSVYSIAPAPGDSLNRNFVLLMHRDGDPTTVKAFGKTDFVLSKDIELDNVLLGNPTIGGTTSVTVDTFDNCERHTLFSAVNQGIGNYYLYIDSVRKITQSALTAYMANAVQEQLNVGYINDEFNYTLYNYDRAGNLAFTVPPAGFNAILDTNHALRRVDTTRLNHIPGLSPEPVYSKINTYDYNSINKLTKQVTIDGAKTRFFYDAAGRLIFSQNAKQSGEGNYTYNIYDAQNRIIETGQSELGCPYFDQFSSSLSATGLPSCSYTYPDLEVHLMGGGIEVVTWFFSPDPPYIHNLLYTPYDSVVAFIQSHDRTDVVMTIYDTAGFNIGHVSGLDSQKNLRKRVACVKYFESLSVLDTSFLHYNYASHFSYDIEGNVQTLTQDFPHLNLLKQRYKRIDYDYDVISGKVNMLSYNRGFSDQYYQKYSYDADNRITKVETSSDGYIWKRDALYTYYEHGPLARVQLSRPEVQGVDYAYTIQGWLKVMNTDTLSGNFDMGMDGLPSSITAKDAVAHTIDYFTNDYTAISGRQVQHIAPTTLSLYNGNISRQTEAIGSFQKLNKQYVYDQLNRINNASYAAVSSVDNTLTGLTAFGNRYSYDKDGNLQNLVRYGNDTGTGARLMDSLTYVYTNPHNDLLMELYDDAADYYSNDIKYYATGAMPARYNYDGIGNTTKDLVSGQDTIEWNLYNKVTYTQNNAGGNFMQFDYDGTGNRVAKYYTLINDTGNIVNTDYYVRDAQGNILAVYHEKDNYRMVPAFWLHSIGMAFRSSAGSSDAFNAAVVLPMFGSEWAFSKSLIHYSLGNKNMRSYVDDLPASTFLQSNRALYNNMFFAGTDYIGALTQNEISGTNSIISPALLKLVLQDPKMAVQVLAALLNDSLAGRHAVGLLCAIPGGDTILQNLATEYCDSQVTVFDCDSLQEIIATDSIDATALAQSILRMTQIYPSLDSYLTLIGTDSLFYNDSVTGPGMISFMQNTLATYGDKKQIMNFFDNYSGSTQMLQQITRPKQLAKIAYNQDPLAFLTAFNKELGDDYVDSCIARVPHLDYRTYLSSASSLLGSVILAGPPIASPGVSAMTLQNFWLAEHDIYGSSRLGIKTYDQSQIGLTWQFSASGGAYTDTIRLWSRQPWYSLEYQDDIALDSLSPYGNTFKGQLYAQHIIGQKQYELTDHLGNVLVTVSDKRANDSVAAVSGGTLTTGGLDSVINWKPVIVTAHDYYPFGQYMPGRYISDTGCNCFTTTLIEMVPTVIYHNVLPYPLFESGGITTVGSGGITPGSTPGSAFISVVAPGDGISYSMTNLTANEDLLISLEIPSVEGAFQILITDDSTGKVVSSTLLDNSQGKKSCFIPVHFVTSGGSATMQIVSVLPQKNFMRIADTLNYGDSSTLSLILPIADTSSDTDARTAERSLGTILITSFGFPKDTIIEKSVVTTVCDKDFYRFGFNKQLKDNEWAGMGNHYDFKFRGYDPRIGRFTSVDPLFKKYPFNGAYNFAEDRVIDGGDLEGLEWSFKPTEKGQELSAKIVVINLSSTPSSDVNAILDQTKTDFSTLYSRKGSAASLQVLSAVNNPSPSKLLNVIAHPQKTLYIVLQDDDGKRNDDGTMVGGATPMFNGATQGNIIPITVNVIQGGKRVPFSAKMVSHIINHELGHDAGLVHPWEAGSPDDILQERHKPTPSNVIFNLMNSEENKDMTAKPSFNGNGNLEKEETTTPGQIKKVEETVSREQKK